jgi:hypothetical protein
MVFAWQWYRQKYVHIIKPKSLCNHFFQQVSLLIFRGALATLKKLGQQHNPQVQTLKGKQAKRV